MTAVIDLKGERFGQLLVIKREGTDKDRNATWLCQCDCGNTCVVSYQALVNKGRISCGCARHTGGGRYYDKKPYTKRADEKESKKKRKENQKSIRELAKAAAEAGMSYGEYVSKHYQNR